MGQLHRAAFYSFVLISLKIPLSETVILTPPLFNLADGRRIYATATCGEGIPEPELYCKLVGANADGDVNINLIQGQVCDYCDANDPLRAHPAEHAIDGTASWWQSPPLSRSMKYNFVNLTIDLGQEFHVAYVIIQMGNSPRPGVWVLERSVDNGQTYHPWQYFADTPDDCERFFGKESLEKITRDDSVVCETQYSKVVPLEGGEIVVSLLQNRPSANDFFNSTVLQEWARATNIRLRLMRTKTLLGHLMSVARQDPTVTRRYFYSIKDISIGGRCVCNGHASICDITDPDDPYKLLCRCQHNTCGDNCDSCCKGFEQKAWQVSTSHEPFVCEACNCFGHTEDCEYNATIDALKLSLDIHGKYSGGGECKNCRDNTEGINCNRCVKGYYRPFGRYYNETDVCQPCQCNYFYSTGNCAEGTGQCECKPEFSPPKCDSCSYGYFDYPTCRPCDCFLNGTRGYHCEAEGGQCPCKPNFGGQFCKICAKEYYGFPKCEECQCTQPGSNDNNCNISSGQCNCLSNFAGRTCETCKDGYYSYPECKYCSCDIKGTLPEICDKSSGQCLCKEGYAGELCDRCAPGYHGYPNCIPCQCSINGSASSVCDASGKCPCLFNFAGRTCNQCSPGYYKYPECAACNCDSHGSLGISCDSEGFCPCRGNFDGVQCNQCKEGFYNYPECEECNCDPSGVLPTFAGCGSLPPGELCQCKSRVHGRICNECKPLSWNLQSQNPEGCESCDCHIPGVMGGIGLCDSLTGQCMCKPSVNSRRCDECANGSYNLVEDNLFGCEDCDCDIGGSLDSTCNKNSGQCDCRPRIQGRTCREPLQTHYFPTLHQFQFEAEDGRTPAYTPVRYGFKQEVFPNYSWKGYAVFSHLQNEILKDIDIIKSSLYRMVLRYINPNQEAISGIIKIVPDNPNEIEQTFQVVFKPTTEPEFVTVAGISGNIPSPLVMNQGRWTVSIKNDKSLFLDYFVLVPEAYYEATILVEKVKRPCVIGETGLCRHYTYPSLNIFDIVKGEGGFISKDDGREPLQEFLEESQHLEELQEGRIPLLNERQPEIHLDMTAKKPGKHVLLVNYVTPVENQRTSTIHVETSTQKGRDKGKLTIYPCPYTTPCRQAVIDKHGRVAIFKFDANFISLILKANNGTNVAIHSIYAIPLEKWSIDYQQPKSSCVRLEGKCLSAQFISPPDSKKVEFESGSNEQRKSTYLPPLIDNTTSLIYLNHQDSIVDISGKVPYPGRYVILVHYFQPDHPKFELKAILHNGQAYEAVLPVEHCSSQSGCRSLIRQADGNNQFSLTENFLLSLQEFSQKGVWLDYVLAIPVEQFNEDVLHEEPIDHTLAFVTHCAKDQYFIDVNVKGFCRDAVFSLTSEYNNGALKCQCDSDGSLSFNCEKFGGQCDCKKNVIGRKCDSCQTGYYGFPDCRPCNCPSTLCEPETGECICPTHVKGERCDVCEDYTYGFDQLIGCEECNCNPHGVLNGNLQCDLLNGSCSCKPNVVGRKCDSCQPGNWGYPYCDNCDCNLQGTTEEICDQRTAQCLCKINAIGPACEHCKEGTFHLDELNPDGCTKCWCSGKTTLCTSALLFRRQIMHMQGWELGSLEGLHIVKNLSIIPEQMNQAVGALLTMPEIEDKIIYFIAPPGYNGNQLTAYGGTLNYTIFYTTGNFGGAISEPDVIIKGRNIVLLHYALEQPPSNVNYNASLRLVESNFILPKGLPAQREHIMQALQSLEAIYIRATYWEHSLTTRLGHVGLDVSSEEFIDEANLANEVEQCECPPNYIGLSCEDCAPGYYRSPQKGPYGGFCVQCQCNGHSNECDVNTGKCLNCQHDTTGDHCELCAEGYHGDATIGTPKDCLICACPLPIPSNNFASSCQVDNSGTHILCECKPGYYGAKCESCAAGFYGRPEFQGEVCRPCDCSGNININDPAACDSVSGECLRCLNNTAGSACGLCAPGYFGDAISRKDCQSCNCDKCGTRECSPDSGECLCHENVIGSKCDRCEIDHFGFNTCGGCTACNCGLASESTHCDENTGQCKCNPGVTGRKCDRCISGYWDYTEEGCKSCGCREEYSVGVGCDPLNGQCTCLPGVIGERCDHCPHRWVLIETEGCFECDSCTHGLLDVTDDLEHLLSPTLDEFENVALGYFTNQRLSHINNTANELVPKVDRLDPSTIDLHPETIELAELESKAKALSRQAEYVNEDAAKSAPTADRVREDAIEIKKLMEDSAGKVNEVIYELENLSTALEGDSGGQIESALQDAQAVLEEIKSRSNVSLSRSLAEKELLRAKHILERAKAINIPVHKQNHEIEDLNKKINNFIEKLDDLNDKSLNSKQIVQTIEELNKSIKGSKVKPNIEKINSLQENASKALKEANEINANSTSLLTNATNSLRQLEDGGSSIFNNDSQENIEKEIEDQENQLEDVKGLVGQAQNHAEYLTEKAQELAQLLEESQYNSQNAVDAANSYNNIVKAIEDAINSLNAASEAASNATDESLATAAQDSHFTSTVLLENAINSLNTTNNYLVPQLEMTVGKVEQLDTLLKNNDMLDNSIRKAIDHLSSEPLTEKTQDSIDNVTQANEIALEAIKSIAELKDQIPEFLKKAQQLPRDQDDASKSEIYAQNQIFTLSNVMPNINDLLDKLDTRKPSFKNAENDIANQIAELREKINLARNLANGIKVGVTFHPNTTLQLRNPRSLQSMTTSFTVSLYFKTRQPNGLLLYIGNEIGTNKQLRRVKTDDFMALMIENGYPLVVMDLGGGASKIISDKQVNDDQWYQIIVNRIGKSVKLTIMEEDEYPKATENMGVVSGRHSIFQMSPEFTKIFAGGYPSNFQMQTQVIYNDFEGNMEDLVINDEPVSLWNFVDAENNENGSRERDKLINLQTSTGLRYDGRGYSMIPSEQYFFLFEERLSISMKIKTKAKDGLLFLAGQNPTFISLELKDGNILYQFDLGDGRLTLLSPQMVNDNKWHSIEVVRQGRQGVLKIDNEQVFKDEVVGASERLTISDYIYFGGYQGRHNFTSVSNIPLEGCIDQVYFNNVFIDLIKNNAQSFGTMPGCPLKVASVVSFNELAPGYVKWPNISTIHNPLDVNLKFRTARQNGLIWYAADREQTNVASLSLHQGSLVFKSQGLELATSPGSSYADEEWHVVSATHDRDGLWLSIDDYEMFKSDQIPELLRFRFGRLYLGGLPEDFVPYSEGAASTSHFIGCLGDGTVNGQFINFANASDTLNAHLGSCDAEGVVPGSATDHPMAPTTQLVDEEHEPEPGEGRPRPPPQPLPPKEDLPITTEAEETITLVPTPPVPTPASGCALPLNPAEDTSVTPAAHGYLFGTAKNSHITYNINVNRLRTKFEFTIEFKTNRSLGVMFYGADENHKDFVGVFMSQGRIHYLFDCGSGRANLSSILRYDNDEWHRVVFSRDKAKGFLMIDDDEPIIGNSQGESKNLNIVSPLYVGGVSSEIGEKVKANLRMNHSFVGCLRNFRFNNKTLKNLSNKEDVLTCSENVESGIFLLPSGGHLQAHKSFKVGLKINIKMEIRPRNISGLLMSVHSDVDYLLLQMVNGNIKFTVDNGKGAIEATFTPPNSHYFCDGNWHTIHATKTKNVVSLAVDNIYSHSHGKPGSSSTDTKHPLYIGGHPNPGSLKGIETLDQYVGCIKNVNINGKTEPLSAHQIVGNAYANFCPTI